jgi:TctA family transporter
MVDNILLGISIVFTIEGVAWLLLGCILGTIVGVLPGLGTVATLAILFPLTHNLDPVFSLMMMAGIYYGAQYGGSTTSILINTPGEVSTIMTCIDGYPMTKKGEGGKAIVAVGISSFIAGILTILLIGILTPLISDFVFKFGAKELSLLMLLGLISISVINNKDPIIGMIIACVGILLGTIGTDISTGIIRFSENSLHLFEGISIPVLAIGIFGISEILRIMFEPKTTIARHEVKIDFTFSDLKKVFPSSIRGSFVGALFGLIPGGGTIMATFAAYAFEKKVSKNKDEFGKGAIEGVSAPEAANNASAQTGFVPLLTLGIPENAVLALILGTLIVAGVQPGPIMIQTQPEMFWGLLVSMVLGNCILVIFNIPLVKVWLTLLNTPKNILYPILFLICIIGVYSINESFFEVGLACVFGIFGYILSKFEIEPAPMMFGFIIGSMFEEYFRRSLIISQGDFFYFTEGYISQFLLTIIIILLTFGIYKFLKNNV